MEGEVQRPRWIPGEAQRTAEGEVGGAQKCGQHTERFCKRSGCKREGRRQGGGRRREGTVTGNPCTREAQACSGPWRRSRHREKREGQTLISTKLNREREERGRREDGRSSGRQSREPAQHRRSERRVQAAPVRGTQAAARRDVCTAPTAAAGCTASRSLCPLRTRGSVT